jgi:hypothetical protein
MRSGDLVIGRSGDWIEAGSAAAFECDAKAPTLVSIVEALR